MEWLWNKIISTSIQQKLKFQKNKNKMIFKQLAVHNIQICTNRCLVSLIFGRFLYSTVFSF